MAITGPSSFIPTVQEFLFHWLQVNAGLGVNGPLVMPDGTTQAMLTTHHVTLTGFKTSIAGKVNDVEIARGQLDLQKTALLGRLGEFNRKVRGLLSHTAYVHALPLAPSSGTSAAVVIDALEDMGTLWVKINAASIPGFTSPLTLLGGYAVATFDTDLAALRTAANAWQNAVQDVKLERDKRNDLQDLVYPLLKDYRQVVQGLFAPSDALVDSLPRLSPDPGSTPDPVAASGVWDAATLQAKLTWSASSDPHLSHSEIRFCAGADYSTNDETSLGTVLPSEPLEFLTAAGLSTPGSTASFKVYVILTTNNEKGSNTVTITRP